MFVDDKGSIDEPVALLWPSLFTDYRMWDSQVTVLRNAGWRMVALDPPGDGQSPGPDGGFTMDQCAEAALQVLDALDVRAPIMALGTSWGGFVVPRMAVRAPGRIGGMILFNTSAERPLLAQRVNSTIAATLLSIRLLKGFADRIVIASILAAETRRRRPDLARDLAFQAGTWDRGHTW